MGNLTGNRAHRLFMESLGCIEAETRDAISRLTRKPRGWHLGQDDMDAPIAWMLPDRYLDRYDRQFCYRMLGSILRLRGRLLDPNDDHMAHSVIEEIIIRSAIRDVEQDGDEDPDQLEAWLEEWLGDLDVDMLYDPRCDERLLKEGLTPDSGDMTFEHWFDQQYWMDPDQTDHDRTDETGGKR